MNDATAACVAELVFGKGAEFQSYLYFFVGTFIGGGVVLDGRLYSGQFGNAGAVGSLPIRGPEGDSNSVQLLAKASAITLEEALAKVGLTPEDIKNDPMENSAAEVWLRQAAQALALAAVYQEGARSASARSLVRHLLPDDTIEAHGCLG